MSKRDLFYIAIGLVGMVAAVALVLGLFWLIIKFPEVTLSIIVVLFIMAEAHKLGVEIDVRHQLLMSEIDRIDREVRRSDLHVEQLSRVVHAIREATKP